MSSWWSFLGVMLYCLVKLMQVIWSSGTRSSNALQWPDLQIGHPDISPSNVRQGDIVCLNVVIHVVIGTWFLRCRMGMDLNENENDLWYLLMFLNKWKYYDFLCCQFPVAFIIRTRHNNKNKQVIKTKHVGKCKWVSIEHGSIAWWRHQMETFSALQALCAGNSPVTDEFPTQRQVTRSFDVFSDLRLNKRLSIQSWGWWFKTPSCSLWRHCNGVFRCICLFSTGKL